MRNQKQGLRADMAFSPHINASKQKNKSALKLYLRDQ